MFTDPYTRACFITGTTTAGIVLILATAETQALIHGTAIPVGLRHWLLWGSLAGFGSTVTLLRMQSMNAIRRNQDRLFERLDHIDQQLDTAGIQGIIRAELDHRLSSDELTDAVERAFATTITATRDYQAISKQMATVTPLSPRILKD